MRRAAGFTLIEILAVVFLIGIMATAATVVFSSGGSKVDLDNGVERFVKYAQRMSELSILTGEPMGLVLTPPQRSGLDAEEQAWVYSWKRFVEVPTDNGIVPEWMDAEGIPATTLDANINLFVQLEGNEWEWQTLPNTDLPIFVVFPSGEVEPYLFEVEFTHNDTELKPQHVAVNDSGRIEWQEKVAEFDALEQRLQRQ